MIFHFLGHCLFSAKSGFNPDFDSDIKTIFKKLRFSFLPILILFSMNACNSSKSNSSKIIKSQQKLAYSDSSTSDSQKKGIDFIAYGDNPVNWKLEMDFDYSFEFNAHDNEKVSAQPVSPVKNSSIETYHAVSGKQQMDIYLFEEKCELNNNKNNFNKRVEIKIGQKIYKGCGNFLYNNKLNDFWILDFINNEQQFALNYPNGIPSLIFNLAKNKLHGFNGCGFFDCNIEVRGNRIQYYPFSSLNISCKENTAAIIMNDYISGQLVDYYFSDNKLVLYLNNDTRLIFRKQMN
jgi:hypothetical protein